MGNSCSRRAKGAQPVQEHDDHNASTADIVKTTLVDARNLNTIAESKQSSAVIIPEGHATLHDEGQDPLLDAVVRGAPSEAPGTANSRCQSCAETCSKPLRCAVCKVVTYCSIKCQKDDWKFHKGTCKSPTRVSMLEEPRKGAEVEQERKESTPDAERPNPSLAKESVAPDLPVANNSGCQVCAKSCAKPLRCTVCKVATYCSATCQKQDWKSHKNTCQNPVQKGGQTKGYAASAREDNAQKPSAQLIARSTQNGMERGDTSSSPCDFCMNCKQPCTKTFKCGVCKAATYCSSACQREDWQFHKRLCKKAKPKIKCTCGRIFDDEEKVCALCKERRPEQDKASINLSKGAKIKVRRNGVLRQCTVVNVDATRVKVHYNDFENSRFDEWLEKDSDWIVSGNEDVSMQERTSRPVPSEHVVIDDKVDDWYRHREWRPDKKQDFLPTRIDANEEVAKPRTAGYSSWNAAGTWEDKNMMEWWRKKLSSLQFGEIADKFVVSSVTGISGDASIVYIRGTPRFLFDLEFEVEIVDRIAADATHKMRVSEFTNDAEQQLRTEISAPSHVAEAVTSEFVPKLKIALGAIASEYEKQG